MINAIQKEIKNQEKNELMRSENGAFMFKTSGQNLLDMNFRVASYRGASENKILSDWKKAFADDPELAVKWLFYVRDVREGLGERDTFRKIANYLSGTEDRFVKLINQIPEFGRWDDLFSVYGSNKKAVCGLISAQLNLDKKNMKENKSISLLAKWLPSVNTSSKGKRNLAREIAKELCLTERNYRKTLAELRDYLDVIEVKTSGGKWNEINYEAVPSQANLKYRTAFFKHDEERRREFLSKLEKGETKINAGTTFPHDIVSRVARLSKTDAALEAMWKALPSYGVENTLVVADGSGSMTSSIPGTNSSALDVANALAIYCAEHNSGEFRDKYITFSENPRFVDFSKCTTLLQKIQTAMSHNEVANTDIYRVFKLVLNTAVKNNMKQEDFVKNILVISDMEFDQGTSNASESLFTKIAKEYADAGYDLPRLIFWNVNSRTGAVPVNQNKLGVALVSGFSVHIAKMVMSGQLCPFEALKEVLMGERYKEITLGG